MNNENAIIVKGVTKKFKVYFDKGNQLKEKLLFWNRNRYEDRWVLNGIDFEVKKGEAVALVGHNGCGKSTMLKMLTKIMYPDSGTIETKGRISCLIELGAGFHPDMSGRENIYINASIFGLSRKEIDERIEEIINFSELHQYIDNPVRTYSSGMYMRLAFAVAINVDADILLIDEILAVGDAKFQAKCFNRLREIKAMGKTIVMVTHDTGTVETFCDRAVWINEGNVAAIGEAAEVVHQYLDFMTSSDSPFADDGSNGIWEKFEKPNLRIKTDLSYSEGALTGKLLVTNRGQRTENISAGSHPVNIGISLVDQNGVMVDLDYFRLPVQRFGVLEQDETIEIPVSLKNLDEIREKGYGLRFAIVKEGVSWLNETSVYYWFNAH